jgi:hypothetical protein
MIVWAIDVGAAALFVAGALLLVRLAIWRLTTKVPAPAPPPADHPRVTVQLPVRDEREAAVRLLRAVAALRWPRDRLDVQLLDDSEDRETSARLDAVAAELRAGGLAIEVLRRPERRAAKAGNLAHGLAHARGELLLVLDADSVPPPDLVERLAAELATDDTLAFAQARWAFENERASALTRAQALILTGLFAVEQPFRASRRQPIACNGTSVLLRRRAVEEAGGWLGVDGSDASVTEDLDLADRLARRGLRGITLVEPAVVTELPESMATYRAQQERWLRGNGEAMRAALARGGLGAVVGPLVRQARQPVIVAISILVIARALGLVPAAPSPLLWPIVAPLVVVAFALYAVAAARATSASTLRAALAAPLVVALSVGLAPALTAALARGLLSSRPGTFVRTPKRGDAPTKTRVPTLAFVELALGVAALAAAARAAVDGAWLTAAGTALFVSAGLLWVGAATVSARARRATTQSARPPVR